MNKYLTISRLPNSIEIFRMAGAERQMDNMEHERLQINENIF